jgi:zinc transport system substrate-binding protein
MRYTLSLFSASLAGLCAAAPLAAEVPVVVADIPPVHALVAQVMGDLGRPVLLMERGGDAHDVQLRPSQAAALADAGLVVWIGPEMTPWLDRALDGLAGDSARLALLGLPGTMTRAFSDGAEGADAHDHGADAQAVEGHDDHDAAAEADDHGGHGDEAAAEAGAQDHAEEGDDHAEGADGHDDHGSTDPHAWLDPGNAQVWLAAIAAELARIDPANAAAYTANAATAAAGIAALDADLAARLGPLRDRPFAVFHDAYGYFTDHYGLTVAGTIALGDAASPGAARLRALQADLAGGGALCIFPEANHDPALVETLADSTGTRIGGALDPEGSAVEPGPGAYAAMLTAMADTLAACLSEAG